MTVRETVVAVKDEGRGGATGNTRSLLVSVSQPAGSDRWENIEIRQDATYDVGAGGDFVLGANLRSGSSLLVGATWGELAGDGQAFDCSAAAGGEIVLDFYGQLGGAVPGRGTRVPAGAEQRPVVGAVDAVRVYSVVIAEDGYFLPGAQVANFEASLRPLTVPTSFVSYYTTVDEVETVLRAAMNREAGFRAQFLSRIQRAISAAERQIDGWCNTSFRAATAAEDREYQIGTPILIEVDDLNLGKAVSVTYEDEVVPEAQYDFRRLPMERSVGRFLVPRRGNLYGNNWCPQAGRMVTVNGWFEWPSVPAEVRDYAGRLAAQIFDDDAARHGLTGDATAYVRKPGADMKPALRHLRRGIVG